MNKMTLSGLGNAIALRGRPYSERLDFAEEIGFEIDRFNLKVGNHLNKGNYCAAKIDLDFFASKIMARLRVAAKYEIMHPRDFLPLAKDLTYRVSEIRDEINHAERTDPVIVA